MQSVLMRALLDHHQLWSRAPISCRLPTDSVPSSKVRYGYPTNFSPDVCDFGWQRLTLRDSIPRIYYSNFLLSVDLIAIVVASTQSHCARFTSCEHRCAVLIWFLAACCSGLLSTMGYYGCSNVKVAFSTAMPIGVKPMTTTAPTAGTTCTPHGAVTMNRKNTPRRKGDGAKSRLPKEKRAKFKQFASEYGLDVPRPGQELDRQYTSKDRKEKAPSKTLYQMLADTFGVSTLDSIEGAVYLLLGILLLGFISSGLLIASEAFFKASKQDIPPSLDVIAIAAEHWFTPALFLFLGLSSVFGIYKQSQLNSGVAQYDEDTSPPSR